MEDTIDRVEGEQEGELDNPIRVGVLTDDETIAVGQRGREIADIFLYIRGPECDGLTIAQKNAFYSLALTLGLDRAIASFHPGVGIYPDDLVDMSALENEAMPFLDEPPPLSPVPPVAARHVGFVPIQVANPIRPDPLAPLAVVNPPPVLAAPPAANADLSALLQRLAALENNQTDRRDESVQLVPCPPFGTGTSTTLAVKNLKILYGTEKYSSEDMTAAPIQTLLSLVSSAIQKHGLNEESAYICLGTVLKGDLHSIVINYNMEKRPFAFTWKHLQISAASAFSRDQCEKEIHKLLKTRPVAIAATLNKLQLLYRRQYYSIRDPVRKAATISTRIIEDIWKIINAFYATSYSQIENMLVFARQRSNNDEFDEASELITIATNYINKRQAQGIDTANISSMDVEAQITAVSAAPAPSRPSQASVPSNQPQQQVQQNQQVQAQPQQPQQQPQQYQQQQQQPFYQYQSPSYQQVHTPQSGGRFQRPQGQGQNQHVAPGQYPVQQQGPSRPRFFRPDVGPGQCFKCLKQHFARDCRTYQRPSGTRKCHFCGGYHSENCVTRPRGQSNQNQSQAQNSQTSSGTRRGTIGNNVYVPRGASEQSQQQQHSAPQAAQAQLAPMEALAPAN